jgi:hypothetical protein
MIPYYSQDFLSFLFSFSFWKRKARTSTRPVTSQHQKGTRWIRNPAGFVFCL